MAPQSYQHVNRQMQNLSISLLDQNRSKNQSDLDRSILDPQGLPEDYPMYEDYGGASFFGTYFSRGKNFQKVFKSDFYKSSIVFEFLAASLSIKRCGLVSMGRVPMGQMSS